VGRLDASALNSSPQLRKQNRIKTITGTLAIEGNTLTEEQITAIVEGKPVLGSVRELAEVMVERLHEFVPRQQFELKIQARADGRIIASRKKSAMRKDVTGYLYGGDVSRKQKLLQKQKKGKKKMLARGTGKVHIPHDVFMKVMKAE
jgi:translation elongation factor EF-4